MFMTMIAYVTHKELFKKMFDFPLFINLFSSLTDLRNIDQNNAGVNLK